MSHLSDDEIIAQYKASTRMMWRLVCFLLGGLGLIVAIIAAAVFSGHADLVMGFWAQVIFAVTLCLLILIAMVGLAKYYKPPLHIASPCILRRQIDKHQRRWRWTMLVNVFTMLICALSFRRIFATNFLATSWHLLFGATVALLVLMFALMLSVGPGWAGLANPGVSEILNDDFVQALQAKTMRVGYFAMLLLTIILLFVAILRPNLIASAICWSLYAGFALPALYYIIADWRASHGKEDSDG